LTTFHVCTVTQLRDQIKQIRQRYHLLAIQKTIGQKLACTNRC